MIESILERITIALERIAAVADAVAMPKPAPTAAPAAKPAKAKPVQTLSKEDFAETDEAPEDDDTPADVDAPKQDPKAEAAARQSLKMDFKSYLSNKGETAAKAYLASQDVAVLSAIDVDNLAAAHKALKKLISK